MDGSFMTYRFFWVVTILPWVGGANSSAHRAMLERLQFPDYDSGERPNADGEAVLVEVDLALISVGPINEMDMTWGASFYLRQEWTDERLVLDDPRWSDRMVKLERQKVGLLWLPDLVFSNNKQGKLHRLTVPNQTLKINASTGRVFYSQRLTVVLSCEMDLIKFPHDNQTCHMKIESYGFLITDLVLRWSSSRVATSLLPSANVPDFSIHGIHTYDCTTTYDTGTFACLQTTMKLSREIGFYIFQTYLPSILIVILSWASFWIDHEAIPARISVGLLTVLTITTQLSGSRAQLPRVPYIKAIDVWMSTNLVFVFAAYMEYAVVTVLSRRYRKQLTKRKAYDAGPGSEVNRQKLPSVPLDREHSLPVSTTTTVAATANGNISPCTISTAAITDITTTTTFINDPDPSPSPPPPRPVSVSERLPVNSSVALDSRDTGRKVDKLSRFLFPLIFALFNVIYWSYYLNVVI